jgi:membrane protease YdiL (CAAX protease family)
MRAVGRYLRSRSDTAEFLFVFIVAWLPNVVIGVAWIVLQLGQLAVTEEALFQGLGFELIILAIIWPVLRLRGWTLARFGLRFRPLDFVLGLGVVIAIFALFLAIGTAIWLLPGGEDLLGKLVSIPPRLPVATVFIFSLLNAIFEEVLLCGYFIGREAERGREARGIALTAAIRLLCHLYEGWIGGAAIALMGLGFGWAYARTGRLWPIIIGHALYDAAALLGWIG